MTGFDVRYTPLFAALGYGVTSIEIYLWLQQGVLYVSLSAFSPPLFSISSLNENPGWS